MHRLHARRAGRAAVATAFVSAPEPRTIGSMARGRQLLAGNFLFSGLLVEGAAHSIWDIADQNPQVAAEIHGCTWLDDLAAIGDGRARTTAQDWVFDWIARYGRGAGPGWIPDLVGRRLIRWINHGFMLLRGRDPADSARFFQSLGQQCIFLSRRWPVTTPGLPRFEALVGTIYAGLALEGMEGQVDQAIKTLAADCMTQVRADGGIATRNPEELLETLSLLNWTVEALNDTGREVPPQLLQAIDRIVPTLRALRHANGELARFHGGSRGPEGRLDEAIAQAGVRAVPDGARHMGFLRLTGGRTSIIVDAASPPKGPASSKAHASTLGMEITSGRRPLIVNCGSGAMFGEEWRRASRATPSHSTLGIEGVSSSHLSQRGHGPEWLRQTPQDVKCVLKTDKAPHMRAEMSHDGYRHSHGLTHARMLDLSVDGRRIEGEDLLAAISPDDGKRFDRVMDASAGGGLPFDIRFHLHPDVVPTLDMGGRAISLTLLSGEIWVFRHDDTAEMTLLPSVYLENGRLKPRQTQQVVLSARAMAYATRVRWSLAKAQSTPNNLRDFAKADPMGITD